MFPGVQRLLAVELLGLAAVGVASGSNIQQITVLK
jgi:hypothetical protein